MKWKLIGNLLGALFLVAILVFAAYMLVPFVRYLSIPMTGGTAAPMFNEDPAVVKIKAQNRAKYFNLNTMGNASTIVPTIKEVPIQNGWLNTAPLDLHALAKEDKFILIDFCTYSLINCYRESPYVESLWKRYKDYGLVVVGVHSPEFDFEKNPANILNAIKAEGITYPVVTDGEKQIWNKFGNHFWPGNYLIDPHGEVVYTQFGEGGYAKEEETIRKHLAAFGWELPNYGPTPTYLDPIDQKAQTPELYAGAGFIRRRLGNDEQPILKSTSIYTLPKQIQSDRIYLSGSWKAESDYLQAKTDGQVIVNYLANSVYIVLAQAVNPIMVEVQLDGMPVPENIRGKDIIVQDGKTYLQIIQPRLYFPIKDKAPYGRHTLTLLTPPGLRLYSFTFGVY
jgi:peroxiredoxin